MITFPIAVIVHFSMNCVIITQRVKWCEEDCLSSSFAFLSTRNESGLLDRLDAERTTPVKKDIPSSRKESECAPSTQGQSLFHQSVLKLLGILTVLDSAVPALSCPNEALRQVVFHLDRNDAPFLKPFWRPLLAELLHAMNWQE